MGCTYRRQYQTGRSRTSRTLQKTFTMGHSMKPSWLVVLSIVLVCQFIGGTDGHMGEFFTRILGTGTKAQRQQVVDTLLGGRGRYDQYPLPPQRNVSGPVAVRFSLGLIRIVDFDEQNLILTLVSLERYNWMDLSMAYKDEYTQAPLILPKEAMWLPDLKVIGGLTPDVESDPSALPLVYRNGEIMYLPKVKHVVGCVTSQSEHTCTLTFNSWHYSGNQVSPDFYGQVAAWDMTNLQEHPKWRISGHDARRHVRKGEGSNDQFVTLTYTLRLQRK